MAEKKRGWNANLPTRWLTDPTIADLSGGAFTTHARALMMGVEHESDGAIPTKALRLLVPIDADASEVVAELIEAGLWEQTDSGFQIARWAETQTTRAEAQRTRRLNADRQRRFQDNKRVDNALVTQPPEIRQDQARTDQDSQDESASNTTESEPVVKWPVAVIPTDPGYCSTHGLPWPCRRASPDCEHQSPPSGGK